ncbi:MAG TPA: NfeD family protein [Planctomycetota bacterium]|nr:NfeD family protein [Planctomycetota bacterium]
MSWEVAIVVFIFGVFLVILELFVPSFGLLTMGAIACFIASVWGVYDPQRPAGAIAMGILAPVLALSVLYFGLKYVPRMSWGRGLVLRHPQDEGVRERPTVSETVSLTPDGGTAESELSPLVGKEGIAHSELRPAGVAFIGSRRVDVVTEGSLIPANTRIRVVTVEGNRVVVRKVQV